MTAPTRPSAGVVALAVTLDALCILAFCAVGRRNHGEGVTPAGVAETAWPFLIGMTVGWLWCRGWRAPTALRPTGVWVWAGTIGVGMGIRFGIGAGVAWSFVLVATLVTGSLILGWRATASGRRRCRRHRSGS